MSPDPAPRKSSARDHLNPIGIGIGLCLGAGLGVALGNFLMGVGVGLIFGAAIALAMGNDRGKKRGDG